MIAAILAFKALPGSKAFRKRIHLILHMVALVLGIVGVCAAFKHHNIKGITNLYSLHSWLGIITMILYGLQVFSSLLLHSGILLVLLCTHKYMLAQCLYVCIYICLYIYNMTYVTCRINTTTSTYTISPHILQTTFRSHT